MSEQWRWRNGPIPVPVLLHGPEPGLVDELIEALCRGDRSLRRRIEIGLNLRGCEQIVEVDTGRLQCLLDRASICGVPPIFAGLTAIVLRLAKISAYG